MRIQLDIFIFSVVEAEYSAEMRWKKRKRQTHGATMTKRQDLGRKLMVEHPGAIGYPDGPQPHEDIFAPSEPDPEGAEAYKTVPADPNPVEMTTITLAPKAPALANEDVPDMTNHADCGNDPCSPHCPMVGLGIILFA